MTTPKQRDDAAALLDAVARCNSGHEAIAVILGAFREQVQIAYAEGREDRDRIRADAQAARDALADLCGAVDRYGQHLGRLADVYAARDRARAYLDREAS